MTNQDSANVVSTMYRVGHQDSASAPAMYRVGHQDSASAPTTHRPHPCPYTMGNLAQDRRAAGLRECRFHHESCWPPGQRKRPHHHVIHTPVPTGWESGIR